MDPRGSPYTPGAGIGPTVLVGRADVIESFDVMLDRLALGRSGTAPLVTGARGSGKTVLHNELLRRARNRGWYVAAEEAIAGAPLPALIAVMARDVLLQMRATNRLSDRVKRALGVLKAFVSVSVAGIKLEINTDPVPGTADTGILELDLRRLFVEIGEVARSQGVGVLFALDEVHTLPDAALATVDTAIHGTAQRSLPVAFLGTGLFPSWKGTGLDDPTSTVTHRARTEVERHVRLDPLNHVFSRLALIGPALVQRVRYDDNAAELAVRYCQGNPWLLQLVGDYAWRNADTRRISYEAVRRSLAETEFRLGHTFFPRLLHECDGDELEVLLAMAGTGQDTVPGHVLTRADPSLVETRLLALGRLAEKDFIVLAGYTSNIFHSAFEVQFSVPRLRAHLSNLHR
ncbi:ATP-binding protein [Streptomyces sp. NPDC051976]|uniref:ATP-binding protein n=1 Tax=Streptomyces sp. NPDC051976 TaxID=3154947 RepID=UPI0034317191